LKTFKINYQNQRLNRGKTILPCQPIKRNREKRYNIDKSAINEHRRNGKQKSISLSKSNRANIKTINKENNDTDEHSTK